jgi:23S rRNA (cytidine1920-2'-O)/16S rRNA (cytidine1409-2'-O)-methyltransferase
MRLDHYLVQFKNIESRTKAQDLIQNKNISVNQKIIIKSSFDVSESDDIQIQDQEILKYVSRAGLKLEAAFNKLNFDLKNKTVLDIGQSTGGFSDCCLQFGAEKVVGFDVGENQLHEKIKFNSKVTYFEKLNVKNINTDIAFTNSVPKEKFNLIVCDVSFISLMHVVPNLPNLLENGGSYLFLVKPQFECGPENLDKNGIVKNTKVYAGIEIKIKKLFHDHFGDVSDYFESAVLGKEGNLEFFIYGRRLK